MSIKSWLISQIDPGIKGEAYLKAVDSKLSPENIASTDPHEEVESGAEEIKEHKEGFEPAGK